MKIKIGVDSIEIVLDDNQNTSRLETHFIEHALGLKNDGDTCIARRVNASGLSCISYIGIKAEEKP